MCANCGTMHNQSQKSLYPAYGTKCLDCGKLNHLRKVCRSGKSQGQQKGKNNHQPGKGTSVSEGIHSLAEKINESTVSDISRLYCHTLSIDNMAENCSQATLNVQVDHGQSKTSLLCKVDTGAEGNVIPASTYKLLHPQSPCNFNGALLGLTPSTTRITDLGSHAIQHYGTCKLTLSHSGHSSTYLFHVVNTAGPTIQLVTNLHRHEAILTLNYSLQHESTAQAPFTL